MSVKHKTTPTLTFPLTTLADTENVAVCTNLRPDPHWGLVAVGTPRLVASLPGAVPVSGGEFTLADGTHIIIVLHAGALKSVSSDGTVAVIATAVELTDTPTCILPVDGGIIVMFASSRPCRYACSRSASGSQPLGWTRTQLFPKLPPLMFVRNDMSLIGVSIPGFTLDSTYSSTSQSLTDEDGAKVDKIMRDAYIRLSDKALSRGWCIQPVFARYRLIGNHDEVLYVSAPVLVSPDQGLQATRLQLTLTGQGLRQVSDARLTATAFAPVLTYTADPDAAWKTLVREVEIEVTPQLHPYSAVLPGSSSRISYSTAGLEMRVTLSGVNPDVTFGAPGTVTSAQVTAILDHTDRSFMERDADSTLRELSLLDRILRNNDGGNTPENDFETCISAPHAFTASAVARSGDTIAWGGINAIPFDGYALHEMGIKCVSANDTAVPTAAAVAMRDGSSVVRAVASEKYRVTALSPLIVYPSPDAVSVELLTDRYGTTLPLTPTPCRRFSYYLDPSLKPIEFDEDRYAFSVPSASPALRAYPSAVITADAGSPLKPKALSVGDGAAVHSLCAAPRRSNALTAPTSLFYAFSASGISAVSLSDTGRRLNRTLLDRRSVTSPRCVTPLADGVAVLADGALVTITGTSSRPATLLQACDAATIGWSDRYGEIWCLPRVSGEPITVISPDGKVRYTREGLDIAALSSEGSRMYLFTAAGDILDSADEEDLPVAVRHVASLRHTYAANTEIDARVGLFGEDISGAIAFTVSDGVFGPDATAIQHYPVGPGNFETSVRVRMQLTESTRLHREVAVTTPYPSTLKLTRG